MWNIILTMEFSRAYKNKEKCTQCNLCERYVRCPTATLLNNNCVGCGACVLACPNSALELVEEERSKYVPVIVDMERCEVPERITIKDALIYLGYDVGKTPENEIFAPCEVGACYCCAIMVDGEVRPSCVTPVHPDAKIQTELPEDYIPLRVVSGFSPHQVGGVGTPYELKAIGYIEAASFHHGCMLRCPQCQNHVAAFTGRASPLAPREAAENLTRVGKTYGIKRLAYSGGECTLNRTFILECLRESRNLNPEARLHVDTNGAILTPDYLEDLIEAGMTDIGIDLKAARIETFVRITGVEEKLAEYYCKNAWRATEYLLANHPEVFLGIGIPYNRALVSLKEIGEIGRAIARMNPDVQVVVLDYRPMFRRKNLVRPSFVEMLEVKDILNSGGLNTVIVQTELGHFGP